jgi:cytochrome P450
MLRPQFARQQVADLSLEENHLQDMFKHLPTKAGWTDRVDLSPLFFRLTLDSATEFLFGQSVQSQISSLPGYSAEKPRQAGQDLDWTSFGRAFDSGTMTVGVRGRLNEMYWLYFPRHFQDSIREVHKFADYYVNLALTTDLSALSESQLEKGQKREKYIFLKELVQQTRDPVELRSQLLNILLAGRDTTAGLLGWTFFLLVRHPRVFAKLRETILDQFGSYERPKEVSFETLKGCSYLQHTMSEVLRLNATVPLNSRRAVRDTTIPRGGGPDGNSPLYVKKGQEVNYVVHIMHNREDLWGPDVLEFKPERWVGRKPGWEFLPFNGGPRICLGQQFALTEAGYVIVRMLQKFDGLENCEPDPIVRHQYSVTTAPAHVLIRLHEASATA